MSSSFSLASDSSALLRVFRDEPPTRLEIVPDERALRADAREPEPTLALSEARARAEVKLLTAELERARGNRSEVARRLGITRQAVQQRIKRLGIDVEQLRLDRMLPPGNDATPDLNAARWAAEAEVLKEELRRTGGNRSEVARRLGITRQAVQQRIKRLGIEVS